MTPKICSTLQKNLEKLMYLYQHQSRPVPNFEIAFSWCLNVSDEWTHMGSREHYFQDASCSTKRHRRAAVGHWVSLCVKCCRMVDSIEDCDYLQPIGQCSQTICRSQIMMIPASGQEHYHVHSWKVGPWLLQTNKQTNINQGQFRSLR